MRTSAPFEEMRSEFAHDPEYLAERALLEVAEQICEAMEKQGMSRSELARRAGVTRQVLTRFLNTPANTTVLTLARLAQALDLELQLNLAEPRTASSPLPAPLPASDRLEPARAA